MRRYPRALLIAQRERPGERHCGGSGPSRTHFEQKAGRQRGERRINALTPSVSRGVCREREAVARFIEWREPREGEDRQIQMIDRVSVAGKRV